MLGSVLRRVGTERLRDNACWCALDLGVHETYASMITYDGEGHLCNVPGACEKRVLRFFFKSSPSSDRLALVLTVGQGITKLVDMAR